MYKRTYLGTHCQQLIVKVPQAVAEAAAKVDPNSRLRARGSEEVSLVNSDVCRMCCRQASKALAAFSCFVPPVPFFRAIVSMSELWP